MNLMYITRITLYHDHNACGKRLSYDYEKSRPASFVPTGLHFLVPQSFHIMSNMNITIVINQ